MIYKNAEVFTSDGTFVHGGFSVEEGRFTEVFSGNRNEGTDLDGMKVIPGLIDIHTHGNSGADFSDGDYDGLVHMAQWYAKNGVTSFAPASMTLPYDNLEKAFLTARRLSEEKPEGCARIAGINMEGPFFSEAKKGAQNGAYLMLPDIEAFKKLYEISGGLIGLVDLAAELPGAVDFTREAAKLCTVSIGHSDADYNEASAVFDAGATHVTHLFNAMPPIHHRKPGVIGAASERNSVAAELICDGIHVHPSTVRIAFKLFPGRICLISDSLRCTGMPDGEYPFAGQRVVLKGNRANLTDGTIAGSVASLFDCMKNVISWGIPEKDALLAATVNPARELHKENEIGSIESGKAADFVVCDNEWNRKAVYLNGKRIN